MSKDSDTAKIEISPRELVKLALDHKEGPRIPFSLGFGVNHPAKLRLKEYLGHKSIQQTDDYLLSFDDIRHVNLPYIGPPDRNLVLADGNTVDVWGVTRTPVSYTEGGAYDEICHYPLADAQSIADLDAFNWPSPDWYDYEALPGILQNINPDDRYATMLGNGNIFETTWYMRGFEQSLMDLMAEPELIEAILKRVTEYYIDFFDRALTAAQGKIDIVFTADDIAGQNGMLISPEMWRAQLKPWHKKLNARLHEHGVKILYHSDGAAHSVIEDLIDMDIDGWEAVQLDALGMDAEALKKAAGSRLAFHGGISVQQLLPFSNPDEIRNEVARLIRVFGKGGGYIAAPAHAIQAGTPPENIIAMLETARPDLCN